MLEIKTYKELREFIEAFSQRKINLLCLVSRAGLGKSSVVEESLIAEAPLVFSGHTTPLKLYIRLWEVSKEEEEPIVVFDDVDLLFENQTNVALLKQICETKNEKTIRYSTTSPILKNYPQEFTTKCKVILCLNKIKPQDENLKAVMSRGLFVYFNPNNDEILNYLKSWADDEEIISFFEKFKKSAKNLNCRTYIRALELKNSNLDWKKFVINDLEIDPRLFEIDQLLQKYQTDEERLKHWSNSRATYYRFKKLYLSQNTSQNYDKNLL